MRASVGLRLRCELSKQLARQPLALAQPILVGDALAVHPDAVHADRIGRKARLACRQIEYAPVGAAVHAVRIEEQEIGAVARLQDASLPNAEHARRMTGETPRCLR